MAGLSDLNLLIKIPSVVITVDLKETQASHTSYPSGKGIVPVFKYKCKAFVRFS